MKLIDADALLHKLVNTDPNTKGKFSDGVVKAMCFIINAPTVEAEPVRHGRWERASDGAAYCTACKRKMNPSQYGYAFCALCGAKMDLK